MVELMWEGKPNNVIDLNGAKKKYLSSYKNFENYPEFNERNPENDSYKDLWSNKLFWGDNSGVLYYLLNYFKGKIDLIYIDPPFFSGANYQIKIEESYSKYNTIVYFDDWQNDLDSYLQMLYERIHLFKELLSETGLIFIHLDWHASHYIKIILDEIFGQNHFVNNIIWYYYNKFSAGKKTLPRAHDDIFVYSKSNKYRLNELRIARKKPRKQLMRTMVNGVLKNVKDEYGHVKYRTVTDKKLDDVWKIPCLQPASKEFTGFPNQKHHRLLERIIKLGSNEGDLIADFFCGSGTTLLVAEKLNRRWIGCDISEYSIYLTRNRILSYQKKNQKYVPFEIYTNFTKEQKKIIDSGFFKKKITIGRRQ